MKKVFFLILLIPFLGIAYTSTDLSNAVFLGEKGIITLQSSETGYRLDDKITRAEVIGIALKIKGISLPEGYNCRKYFSDTVKQDWVCRAIELASDNELISRSNTKARPQDSITRAEAFSILYKASNLSPLKEYDTLVPADKDATEWQKDLFVKVRNSDIEIPWVQYISDTYYKFFPNRFATRAEVFGFARQIVSLSGTNLITVVDGDTVNYGNLKIRMIGLDAPESTTSRYGYTECFGKEASEHLKMLLKDAKELTIEKDSTQGETDKYGRTLAYIFYNGTNINTKMILDGYAFEYTYNTAYTYQKENKEAELMAKNAQLGLWSASTCAGDRKKGTKDEVKINTPITTPIYTPPTTPPSSPSYTCGAKTYCTQMITCEEAKYYLNSCGLTRLDSDSDGIPCESICQ